MNKTVTVIWDGVTKIAFEKTKSKAKETLLEKERSKKSKRGPTQEVSGGPRGNNRRFLDEAEEAQMGQAFRTRL